MRCAMRVSEELCRLKVQFIGLPGGVWQTVYAAVDRGTVHTLYDELELDLAVCVGLDETDDLFRGMMHGLTADCASLI